MLWAKMVLRSRRMVATLCCAAHLRFWTYRSGPVKALSVSEDPEGSPRSDVVNAGAPSQEPLCRSRLDPGVYAEVPATLAADEEEHARRDSTRSLTAAIAVVGVRAARAPAGMR
jgi:hypothetical protein